MHLFHTGVQVVVDHEIVVAFDALGLLHRPGKAALDHIHALRPPAYQAAFQRLRVWRRQEQKQGVRIAFLDLQRSLNLNLQNNVLSKAQLLFHIGLWRPVIVFHIAGMLKQGVFRDHSFELFPRLEKIFPAVYLILPRLPRRSGNRKCVIIVTAQQLLHDGSLAGSGKARHHYQNSFFLHSLPLIQYSESARGPSRCRSSAQSRDWRPPDHSIWTESCSPPGSSPGR